MKRALAVTFLLVCALAPTAVARDPESRIINGIPTGDDEYPHQGFLFVEVEPGAFAGCGGTVVSSMKFLTAGHCVADEVGQARPASAFTVVLGERDFNDFESEGEFHPVSSAVLHPDYGEDAEQHTNDVAMLTFDAPVSQPPMRIIRPSEARLWEPGDDATIIGWGDTAEGGSPSNPMLEAVVPIRGDADCDEAYGPRFIQSTMVCAGDGSADTCQGDSGGPLLVREDASDPFALTGVVSWGDGCNRPESPGIYARVGAQPLNAWVRGQMQSVDFALQTASPRAGEPVPFAATSPASGNFQWDFDNDGTFDATGAAASHVFPLAGEYETVLRVSDPEGEAAEQRRELFVGPGAPPPPPVITPTVQLPITTNPPIAAARILVSGGRATVRRSRFKVRINFSATAPTGRATVEVFLGRRKIGSGKTTVRRGGSRQVTIKLTKRGRRLLSRAKSNRLRVKVQVRVGRRVLASRNLTIRR